MLKELKERLNLRRLREFNDIELKNDHALPEKFLHSESDLMQNGKDTESKFAKTY
jgi:hypothetical protein